MVRIGHPATKNNSVWQVLKASWNIVFTLRKEAKYIMLVLFIVIWVFFPTISLNILDQVFLNNFYLTIHTKYCAIPSKYQIINIV